MDHAAAVLRHPGAGVLGHAHGRGGPWPRGARGPCTAGRRASEAWLGLESVLCGGGVHGHGAAVRREGKLTWCLHGADRASGRVDTLAMLSRERAPVKVVHGNLDREILCRLQWQEPGACWGW